MCDFLFFAKTFACQTRNVWLICVNMFAKNLTTNPGDNAKFKVSRTFVRVGDFFFTEMPYFREIFVSTPLVVHYLTFLFINSG